MEKNLPIHLHEILFGSSDKAKSKQIAQYEKRGIIRKLAPRIYSSNLHEEPADIIGRNWLQILSNLYPGALLSHRSALEFKPTAGGHIFLTYQYTKNISIPGITIHFLKGSEPIPGDGIFFGNLLVSQEARAYLENFQQTRTDTLSKTLSTKEIEEKLEMILKIRGEGGLNKLRDDARGVAQALGMEKEFKKLDTLVGALLSTRPSKILTSKAAIARTLGEPIDINRIRLFEKLYTILVEKVFPDYVDKNTTPTSFRNFGFFESYFSNYIEGTIFGIDEAKQIITSQKPLPARSEDSHDVLGTYRIVSNHSEMSILPKNPDHFLDILAHRHAVILSARPSKNPGQFKDRNNFASSTVFVDFKEVRGTLKKGFDYYEALRHPFAKAIYMMFLVSEVHPFLDGNGRIARIMMNVELTAKGLSKIIIPTVFRDDYMGALKKLTRQEDCETYIRTLLRAQMFSKNIFGEDLDEMEHFLTYSDAFKEPNEGKLKIIDR